MLCCRRTQSDEVINGCTKLEVAVFWKTQSDEVIVKGIHVGRGFNFQLQVVAASC